MKRIILYPYKLSSSSARSLQDTLKALGYECKRVKPDGTYIPTSNDVVINWGSSNYPEWCSGNEWDVRWLNYPLAVKEAVNKLSTFKELKDHNVVIPDFTTKAAVASGWLMQGHTILARQTLRGHSGNGIILFSGERQPEQLGNAPLYVKYIKKTAEYRIHVFKSSVIDMQQKKRNTDVPKEEVNYQIRSHANGWVFCREGITVPSAVLTQAVNSVEALGLDFGAVDVVWSKTQGAFVLEVNTAPGLEGTTLLKYVDAIIKWVNNNG